MGSTPMDYATMVEEALRGVVRKALIHVSENGLHGDSYFYITFRTDLPGVEIANYLRQRYPQEMTIVLQHQYWGLDVDEDGFSVLLSFNKVPERLRIPFQSLVGFSDPTAQFGLQFSTGATEREGRAGRGDPGTLDKAAPTALPAPKPGTGITPHPASADAGEAAAETLVSGMANGEPEGGDGNVVTLDAFRKKQGQQD